MSKRALLLINSKSRHGQENGAMARESLIKQGFEVVYPEDTTPDRFSSVIRNHAGKVDLVAVGGGDGSLRCSLGGIIATGLPLGVLPLGTANNLARNLGIPAEIPAACEIMSRGLTRTIDVAEVNGHHFLNVAGIGLSVEVNREVPHKLKRYLGVLAYAITALRRFRRLRSFSARVLCDTVEIAARAHQITVCNGRHFGSGLTIQPDATIDDGYLDLAMVEVEGFFHAVGVLSEFKKGSGEMTSGLRRYRCKQMVIKTKRPLNVDVDGDVLTKTPASFSMHPDAIRVFVPAVVESATNH